MKQRRRKKRETGKRMAGGAALRCMCAALVGCVLSVVLLLLYALLLKWELVGEGSIPIATTIIKAFSAALAGLLGAQGAMKRHWLWGGASGGVYIVVAFLAFALLEKAFTPSLAVLADLGLGLVAGGVGGTLVFLKGR